MLLDTAPAGFTLQKLKYGPYSPSRLIAAKCPQRFFGQYIRKDRSVAVSVAADKGNANHYVLSKITDKLKNGITIKPHEIDTWVGEAAAKYPGSYDYVDNTKKTAVSYINKPNPYMDSNTNCEIAFAVALYVEDSFVDDFVPAKRYVKLPFQEKEDKADPSAFFNVKLDQVTVCEITKTVTILDHKSTPSTNHNEDHMFQIGCYAWMLSLFYPGYKIRTVLHYCHHSLNWYAPPMTWTSEEIAEVESYVHSKIIAIELMDDFPAIPGSSCDYCHMIQECEVNMKMRDQNARGLVDLNVRSFADVKRIAEALHATGILYDRLNKSLKQGVEIYATEGVAIDGTWYGHKASEAVDWIATDIKIRNESEMARIKLLECRYKDEAEKALLEKRASIPDLNTLLKQYDIDPEKFKEWKGDKMSVLWRLDKPGLLDLLKDYVMQSKKTRFGAHKM